MEQPVESIRSNNGFEKVLVFYKGVRTTQPSDCCPKHGASYLLRRNVKTGEIAIACPLCDVEARGGTNEDRKPVADKIKSRDDPTNEFS